MAKTGDFPTTQRYAERVEDPGMYRFGQGLFLRATVNKDTGTLRKSWIQRVSLDGRRTDKGLGSLEALNVQDAIDLAYGNRRALRKGENPFADRLRHVAPKVPTFAEVVAIVIKARAVNWTGRTRHDREEAMNRYAIPKLGNKRIDAIKPQDIEAVLKPIWTKHPVAARCVRTLLNSALDWAVTHERRTGNPTDSVVRQLPKPNKRQPKNHMRSLPHAEVGAAILTINGTRAALVTKLSMEFLIHTAGRSGEVRCARWTEIDINEAVWTIPADRMKMGRKQRVPLSAQALNVLRRARALHRKTGPLTYVFDTGRGKPINVTTLAKLMESAGIAAVPHGFRSSFSSWCGDTGQPEDIREAALAHFNKDRVAGVYQRSDLLERRRELMQEWSSYIAPITRRHPQTEAPR